MFLDILPSLPLFQGWITLLSDYHLCFLFIVNFPFSFKFPSKFTSRVPSHVMFDVPIQFRFWISVENPFQVILSILARVELAITLLLQWIPQSIPKGLTKFARHNSRSDLEIEGPTWRRKPQGIPREPQRVPKGAPWGPTWGPGGDRKRTYLNMFGGPILAFRDFKYI